MVVHKQFVVILIEMTLLVRSTVAINHESTMFWTEHRNPSKSDVVIVRGIAGHPSDWIHRQKVASKTEAFYELRSGGTPHMLALGFRYSSRELFFSDRGLKSIFRVKLEDIKEMYNMSEYEGIPSDIDYLFSLNVTRLTNYTMHTIYRGNSADVFGLAVDWLSGTVYWTDARYNWIVAASTNDHVKYKDIVDRRAPRSYEIYDHIVTDLDKPMGIAVYPQKGWMFWSSRGAQPKIERARLDGTERTVLVSSEKLVRPGAVTVDYAEDHLYWTDGGLGTIERCGLDGGDRVTIKVDKYDVRRSDLLGVTIFNDFLYTNNQARHTMSAYNKKTKKHIGEFLMGEETIPYDLMMYHEDIQESIASECASLNCQDMCISLGEGRGKCHCKNGYELDDDNVSCKLVGKATKPRYIYSIGKALCSTKVHHADRTHPHPLDVACFLTGLGHVEALTFNSYADLIIFADSARKVIYRKVLAKNTPMKVVHVQTGRVRGMAADWLSSNLYWTDEEYGHIMVSNMEGRYPRVLLSGLQRPRGIAVDPHRGLMYWVSAGDQAGIYRANMDGTNVELFLQNETFSSPDGIFLDLNEEMLFWTDSNVPGIGVSNLYGNVTDRLLVPSLPQATFRDVTVYHSYIAATVGDNKIYLMQREDGKLMKSIHYFVVNVSHDVITYDDYLQPLASGSCGSQCEQLCLPSSKGFTCQCAMGFTTSGRYCTSELKNTQFLLVLDKYHKQAYQLDLVAGAPKGLQSPQAMGLVSPEQPDLVDYDTTNNMVYWYDSMDNVLKRRNMVSEIEETILSLPSGVKMQTLFVEEINQLLFFTDTVNKQIKVVSVNGATDTQDNFNRDILPQSLTIDRRSGLLYWAQASVKGVSPMIYSQDVLRSSQPKLVTSSWGTPGSESIQGLQPKGMTFDCIESMLYVWFATGDVFQIDPDVGQPQIVAQLPKTTSTLVVVHGQLYYTLQNSRSVYWRKTTDTNGTAESLSDVFSQVADLKAVVSCRGDVLTTSTLVSPTVPDPNTEKVTSSKPVATSLVAVGAVIGASVIIFAVLLAIYCRMRARKARPRVPPSDYKTQSHDNPIYMTTGEVAAATTRLPRGAFGRVSRTVALPPDIKSPLPPAPEGDEKLSQLSLSTEGATGGPPSDTDSALSSAKSLAIDSKQVKVSFSPGTK